MTFEHPHEATATVVDTGILEKTAVDLHVDWLKSIRAVGAEAEADRIPLLGGYIIGILLALAEVTTKEPFDLADPSIAKSVAEALAEGLGYDMSTATLLVAHVEAGLMEGAEAAAP